MMHTLLVAWLGQQSQAEFSMSSVYKVSFSDWVCRIQQPCSGRGRWQLYKFRGLQISRWTGMQH